MPTTLTTNGIVVSVEAFYQRQLSEPLADKYTFSYQITLENKNDFTVQLLRRHWLIFDSNGAHHEVSGEGVVGEQPILKSGETYQYASWCNLKTEVGKMVGIYVMQRQPEGSLFRIKVPEFQLIAPQKMN